MHFWLLKVQSAVFWTYLLCANATAKLTYTRPAQPDQKLINAINAKVNTSNTVIPGGSPFFYPEGPPSDSIFKIDRISMTPNPCHVGTPCDVSVDGTFTRAVPNPKIDFNIAIRVAGEWLSVVASDDDLCEWASLVQDGQKREGCAAAQGQATIDMEVQLPHEWIPLGWYFIDAKLKDGDTVATHIAAKIEMKEIEEAVGIVQSTAPTE